MRQFLTLLAIATGCAGLTSAASFSGTLVDASCYNQQKSAQTCIATSSTSAFMIAVSGKVYQLDDNGNTKAAAAMKERADRSTDPNNATNAAVTAKVTGKLEGNTIAVQTIDVQ
ncbi:MAG TPA: hypothetical protein VME43_30310 [Bryobacteraceae bacterium]|nr:hypothetical protein [Bryobacteraceae bacterium]